jgi:hypothetical protein
VRAELETIRDDTATSASNAATSASNTATSAANAATSETNAATSASNAATSETNAATSATAAQNAANTAEAIAGFDGSYDSLADTPALATVAISGDYYDLVNKPGDPGALLFTDPGTISWTVPDGATSVTVDCLGSGSAGGIKLDFPDTEHRSGAGGGGGFVRGTTSVTPGEVIEITVAAGGDTGFGNWGGATSSFGSYFSATGGSLEGAGVGVGGTINSRGATSAAVGQTPAMPEFGAGGAGGGAGGPGGPGNLVEPNLPDGNAEDAADGGVGGGYGGGGGGSNSSTDGGHGGRGGGGGAGYGSHGGHGYVKISWGTTA